MEPSQRGTWSGAEGQAKTLTAPVLAARRAARHFTGNLKKEANLTPEKAGLLYFHLANSRGALGVYPHAPGLVSLAPNRVATLAASASLAHCLLASSHALAG
jgi:hypothetical protein